ncbi:branched-chain amino acid ABC transporter permease [Rhodopseudomonas sp. BAL398]|uniref:branched-chain amino acid ABC transporter permease n=1 Tax=Rhodopseudomonas sp. BAL398 TaxID=3034676 RepID=UPI00294AE058|nr:branched-chain amino acid ABC transporter permease [Rhodopseudomonas sp. BAL398]WOK17617.1 branched-chain amino acid ABC transporter permease [Rhodopseudomonas sp. BAL398]
MVIVAALAVAETMPHYWVGVVFLAVIYAGVASAWNLAGGIAGTFSFGHGLFFGIGAYTSVLLFSHYGISPWIGMIAGALLAALAGVAIAWLAERCAIGDLAFAVMTLAIAEMAYISLDSFEPFGASRGISLPSANGWGAMQFGSDASYLWTAVGFLVVCQIVVAALSQSAPGYRFRAVRENPLAAKAMGISPARERMVALAASGALTALGGSIYAQYLMFVNPLTFFGPSITIKVILFTMVGGMGTVWGPVIGTILLFPLGEWLRGEFGGNLPGFDSLLYGLLVVICILVFPRGICGTLNHLFRGDWLLKSRRRTK